MNKVNLGTSTYLNCNTLFNITNRIEAIAKYNNGRL